ncbi:hypothetical protein HRI_003319600 [Hibiscus trionum]|uniref:CCHC-type domain-containing protein n=1 Tax=Hibiscus trionum TaxID=183268 RepID=A0A9W7ILY0_HIBTR|nr:hypothetical protein HRI_003319600 [Hibiscus trionum]
MSKNFQQKNPMSTAVSTNPKKHRRLEEEPPDEGSPGDRPDGPTHSKTPMSTADPKLPSYRDSLMNGNPADPRDDENSFDDDDIELLEGDITRSVEDGLICIDFLDRVHELSEKCFDLTVVVKLLGRRIGYTTLRNKLYDLWKPKQAFRLMDIENDYFLASFKSNTDLLHVLTEGPWTIFGHYLTVEPWSADFQTSQPFPTKIWSWICLPGLPATLYKRSLINAIGECIGPVIKIDYQTESGQRGIFARMAIKIDLRKPLIFKIVINGNVQIVEYESLPTVCFGCGKYGHSQDVCPDAKQPSDEPNTAQSDTSPDTAKAYGSADSSSDVGTRNHPSNQSFGPWMLVEKRQRRPSKKASDPATRPANVAFTASRFNPIYDVESEKTDEPASPGPMQFGTHNVHATTTPLNPRNKFKAKGKGLSNNKLSTSVNVRKPLTLADFPVLGCNQTRTNVPKTATPAPSKTPLDVTKHSSVVLGENENPNV